MILIRLIDEKSGDLVYSGESELVPRMGESIVLVKNTFMHDVSLRREYLVKKVVYHLPHTTPSVICLVEGVNTDV